MNALAQDTGKSAVDEMLARSIIDIGIPPCPAILDRFIAETRKDEPDLKRLATIISTDVSLSASLIKTANSPYFGMRQRVRSANEALTVLGLNAASRAIAGIILRNSFPHVPNLERFWDASARIARVSGWLAQQFELKLQPEDAYTYGLFRDCGIPVLLGRFPVYTSILASANQDAVRSFTAIEEETLPSNHAIVGCLLAQSWWLPEEICLAIRNHHDLDALTSETSSLPVMSRRLVATAQLSEHIIQRQLGLSRTQEWIKLGQACMDILGIGEESLETLYEEADQIAAADE